MSEVAIQRLKPDEVTPDITTRFQGMALRAWLKDLPGRSEEELLHVFNPYDSDHLEDVRSQYQEFADQDGLLVALSRIGTEVAPVGFLLTMEDASGNKLEQAWKRRFQREKVYALIQHLVVAPEMQRKGVAKQLGKEALASYKPEQISTAYIFDEHVFGMSAMGKFGYVLDPVDQDPTPRYAFGKDTSPVYQYRFAAPVGRVLGRLTAKQENA
jgi:GNAT superfamily N-acetyltransferase